MGLQQGLRLWGPHAVCPHLLGTGVRAPPPVSDRLSWLWPTLSAPGQAGTGPPRSLSMVTVVPLNKPCHQLLACGLWNQSPSCHSSGFNSPSLCHRSGFKSQPPLLTSCVTSDRLLNLSDFSFSHLGGGTVDPCPTPLRGGVKLAEIPQVMHLVGARSWWAPLKRLDLDCPYNRELHVPWLVGH